MDNRTSIKLSKTDTNVLKGVALILLLIHHLFYIQSGRYDDIHLWGDYYLVNSIGVICKFCVAIFVFLSGYGLAVKAQKSDQTLTQFYYHRFIKLMSNYWLIWIIFVPISIFVFDISFQDAYGNHPVLPMFIGDILGVLNLSGLYGYNPTWWFYSLIIVCYILFPFLNRWMDSRTVFPMLLSFVAFYFLPINYLVCLKLYLFTFALGIAFAKFDISIADTSKNKWICLFLFCLLFAERLMIHNPIIFDNLILIAGLFAYKSFKLNKYLENVLLFLGKHSMNIFLFHTFIKTLWFPDYIYLSRNPIVIFALLLSSCVFVSIIIEYVKTTISFNVLVAKLESLYVR